MPEDKDKLVVLWTSGDKEVALKMVFMYTMNSKINGWWTDVTLVAWGPSTKLLSEDIDLQNCIETMKDSGVELLACKACTDEYGISEVLEKLGFEVKYMGEPLTGYLKDNVKILTL